MNSDQKPEEKSFHDSHNKKTQEPFVKRLSLGGEKRLVVETEKAQSLSLFTKNPRQLNRGTTDTFNNIPGKSSIAGMTVLSTKMHVQKLLNNVMSKNHLKDLLQKPYKTPTESEFILRRIERMKFFQSFMNDFLFADYKLLIDFCSALKHEWHPQGSVIIKQGDFSCDKMYVILTGTVSVYRKDAFAITDMDRREDRKSKQKYQIKF